MKRQEKKEARQIIKTRLDEGKPRKEILEELTNSYNDRSAIAKLIAEIPDRKTKEKYKILNYIVAGCLVLSFLAMFYAEVFLSGKRPAEIIIESLIVFSIYTIFIIEVLKFRGYIYYFLTFLAIIGLISDLLKISELGVQDIIWNILIIVFAGLTFYLGKKIFPNHGFYGLRKDKNGDYLLE